MSEQLLNPRWLRRAQWLNPYFQERLGWRLSADWPRDVGSEEFAGHVAQFQHEHGGLTVDGILGPKTWAALQGSTWKPPAQEYLVIAGEHVRVPFPVVTWEEPGGLSFYGQVGWRRRRNPSGRGVDLLVLHWDGCTSAQQCFHVLLERGLSAHLLLDGDGTVYQTLDLAEASAWHGGTVNERSIGVEIQNPVKLHRNQWQSPPRAIIDEPRVHGTGTWEHLDFYDVQKRRVVELAEALCEHFPIPRALPTQGNTVSRTLAPAGFRGVCGHYHVSPTKPDPGLSLWPALERAFARTPGDSIRAEEERQSYHEEDPHE
jgi:N-acetyl-anhydromuramyl-L-alanine amidase AmpD